MLSQINSDFMLEILEESLEVISGLNTFEDTRDIITHLKNKLIDNNLTVAIVGEVNSGKSTLINSLIGEQILDVGYLETTNSVYELHFSNESSYVRYTDNEDKIHEINDLQNLNRNDKKNLKVYLTNQVFPMNIIIFDTPGISSKNKQLIFEKVIPQANIFFFTLDINQSLTSSSLKFIKSLKKEVLLIITKKDTKIIEEIEELKNELKESYRNILTDVITVSSKENDLIEIREKISDYINRKEIILYSQVKEQFGDICDVINLKVEYLIKINNLDLKELDLEKKQKQIEIEEIKILIDNELTKFLGDLLNIEIEVVRYFETQLFNQADEIIDSTVEKGYKLDEIFKSNILIISDKVILVYYNKIQERIEKLKKTIKNIIVADGFVINKSDFDFTKKIDIKDGLPLLDLASGFFGAMADRFETAEHNELDNRKRAVMSSLKSVARLIELGLALISRKKIRSDLENAFDVVKIDFSTIIHNDVLGIGSNVKHIVNSELAKIEKDISASIENVKTQRQKALIDNNEYLAKLNEISKKSIIWKHRIYEI